MRGGESLRGPGDAGSDLPVDLWHSGRIPRDVIVRLVLHPGYQDAL